MISEETFAHNVEDMFVRSDRCDQQYEEKLGTPIRSHWQSASLTSVGQGFCQKVMTEINIP